MIFTLYCITCTVSGKRYIGMTRHTPEWRWMHHLGAAERGKTVTLLYRAMKKYGAENFVIEAVASAKGSSDACALERAMIAQEGTLKPGGYNMTAGGDGASGYKWTGAQKARGSAALKKFSTSEEGREIRSRAMKGKKRTPEDRAARSVAITKWWAARKARGEKNKMPDGHYERHAERMRGNQNTKGRVRPREEVERIKAIIRANREARLAAIQPPLFTLPKPRNFDRLLWWKEWL